MDVTRIDNLGYGYHPSDQVKPEGMETEAANNEIGAFTIHEQKQTVDGEEQPLSESEQHRRMERLQDTLKDHNIEISYNEEVNRYAIKVLDSDTKEVVKEIPSEKTLEMFARMLEIEGLLVDEKR